MHVAEMEIIVVSAEGEVPAYKHKQMYHDCLLFFKSFEPWRVRIIHKRVGFL